MAKQRTDFAKMLWQGQLFTFLQGPMGKLFVEGDEFLKSQLDRTLWHDEATETYIGSNHRIVTRADSRARELSNGAIRVVTLQDTDHSTFENMIRGKYYADVPEAIIRIQEGAFAEQVAEIAEQRKVPFELPCKVIGLDVKIGEDGKPQYFARNDFALTQHPSLNYENNRKRFNIMEEGFPVFDDNGEHAWYLRNVGSAGVYRDSGLDAFGLYASFGRSDRGGRVVLTADAVGAPEILQRFVRNLFADYEKMGKDLRTKYEANAEKLKKLYDELTGKK